jgi:bifunctional ADP-heptose synthase (sugar kinase/adenylyltransferase)
MSAGFGVPRWNGFTMQDDLHLARLVAVIKFAAQDPEKPAIADAFAAAVANQQGRERAAVRKRKQDNEEAAPRQEKEAVMSALQVELQALQHSDPGMTLLTAVEFVTSDPGRRVSLYGLCSAGDRSIRSSVIAQDEACLLKIASSVDKDLAFLQRRAKAEGFQL